MKIMYVDFIYIYYSIYLLCFDYLVGAYDFFNACNVQSKKSVIPCIKCYSYMYSIYIGILRCLKVEFR